MKKQKSGLFQSIKSSLIKERLRIIGRIEELFIQDPFTDFDRASDNTGDVDAQEESGHDRVSALIEALEHEREQIEQALAKIEDGTYGACDICKAKIKENRLKALPTATRCLSCLKKKQNSLTK